MRLSCKSLSGPNPLSYYENHKLRTKMFYNIGPWTSTQAYFSGASIITKKRIMILEPAARAIKVLTSSLTDNEAK
jgi:hypothetical protein